MAIYNPESGVLKVYGAITGTHLSGKTTVIDSLRDDELTEQLFKTGTPYSIGKIALTDSRVIPVLLIEEMATRIMRERDDFSLATENYSSEFQQDVINAELDYLLHTTDEVSDFVYSASIEAGFNDTKRLLILDDRTALDGFVYLDQILGSSAMTEDDRWPFAASTKMLLDVAFIASSDDIPDDELEHAIGRLPDNTFREAIERDITDLYTKQTDVPVVELSGSTTERVDTISSTVSQLVQRGVQKVSVRYKKTGQIVELSRDNRNSEDDKIPIWVSKRLYKDRHTVNKV